MRKFVLAIISTIIFAALAGCGTKRLVEAHILRDSVYLYRDSVVLRYVKDSITEREKNDHFDKAQRTDGARHHFCRARSVARQVADACRHDTEGGVARQVAHEDRHTRGDEDARRLAICSVVFLYLGVRMLRVCGRVKGNTIVCKGW